VPPAARLLVDPVFSAHIHGFPTPAMGIPPDVPLSPVCTPHIVLGFTTALGRAICNALFKGVPGWTVFINGMPAAQCSDGGRALMCCGPNTYDVFMGSMTVDIEGDRAPRAGDATFHCDFFPIKPNNPPTGPPKPGAAIPPFGIVTSGSANVIIGGPPMPSWQALAMAAAFKVLGFVMKGLLKAAGKLMKKAKSAVIDFIASRVAKGMKSC